MAMKADLFHTSGRPTPTRGRRKLKGNWMMNRRSHAYSLPTPSSSAFSPDPFCS